MKSTRSSPQNQDVRDSTGDYFYVDIKRKEFKMMNEFRKELKITMRSIPGIVTSIFVLSAVLMNILANKSIINHQYVSVTSGIVLSWISYL